MADLHELLAENASDIECTLYVSPRIWIPRNHDPQTIWNISGYVKEFRNANMCLVMYR
jgi:hypothetical protein